MEAMEAMEAGGAMAVAGVIMEVGVGAVVTMGASIQATMGASIRDMATASADSDWGWGWVMVWVIMAAMEATEAMAVMVTDILRWLYPQHRRFIFNSNNRSKSCNLRRRKPITGIIAGIRRDIIPMSRSAPRAGYRWLPSLHNKS